MSKKAYMLPVMQVMTLSASQQLLAGSVEAPLGGETNTQLTPGAFGFEETE